jgi:hypothetical protein
LGCSTFGSFPTKSRRMRINWSCGSVNIYIAW